MVLVKNVLITSQLVFQLLTEQLVWVDTINQLQIQIVHLAQLHQLIVPQLPISKHVKKVILQYNKQPVVLMLTVLNVLLQML